MSKDVTATNGAERPWTFLTNHAQTLLHIDGNPDTRVRDIAAALDITERRVYVILKELEESGYITRERHARRVRLTINDDQALRASLVRNLTVRELLDLANAGERRTRE